jgi:poly-beta-hydroxyalkanoate depolymerase
MAGTPMNQQNQMQMATQLANQDYYNWLQQATGMYGQGLQGAQNIYGGGLQAAGFYGNDLARALEAQAQTAQTQAQAAAAGTQAENQQEASTWGGLGSLIGGLLGFL